MSSRLLTLAALLGMATLFLSFGHIVRPGPDSLPAQFGDDPRREYENGWPSPFIRRKVVDENDRFLGIGGQVVDVKGRPAHFTDRGNLWRGSVLWFRWQPLVWDIMMALLAAVLPLFTARRLRRAKSSP